MTTQEVEKKSEKKIVKNTVAGIDINKLVKKAQDTYDKKEAGVAKQLATGSSITLSEDDADYIVWTDGDWWKKLTGLRGLPFGRVISLSGRSDSGKSSTAYFFMKYAQEQGTLVILVDSEKKFSRSRFDEKIGGCSDNLLVVNTSKITDAARGVAQLIHSAKEMNPNVKILICIDSIGGLINSSEDNEENLEEMSRQPGISAKENSWMFKKFVKLINKYMNQETGKHTILVLCVNQTYNNFGAPGETDKGGNEIYYLSSLIVRLNRKQDLTRIKDGEKYKWGILSVAKIRKNHLFDGNENIAELEIVVSAGNIQLASDVKNYKDVQGWDNSKDEE